MVVWADDRENLWRNAVSWNGFVDLSPARRKRDVGAVQPKSTATVCEVDELQNEPFRTVGHGTWNRCFEDDGMF